MTIEEAAELGDDPEVLAAHLEGIRKLSGWEADERGRERREAAMGLFKIGRDAPRQS
jgi:hypothetical protein